MNEYFVITNTISAPVFPIVETSFVQVETTPEAASEKAQREYDGHYELAKVMVFKDANSCFKGEEPLFSWTAESKQ